MDLVALKTEITTDPAAIGYAAVLSDHVAVAKLINTAARQVADTDDKPIWQLFQCFDPDELTTAEAVVAKFRRLQLLCSLASVNPDAKRLRQSIVFIFGAQSQSLTRFDAWAKRSGTRAEELGFGRVTESDVADALRS
jgi:hypothetical protein